MQTRRAFGLLSVAAAGWLGGFGRAGAGEAEKGKFPVQKTDEEWRKALTKEQYYVLRDHGTERAFTSPLDKNYTPGRYDCAGCGHQLFTSDTKFNSGTGWPSFWQPLDKAVGTKSDRSFFMVRTEVHCANCGGHLGHVFDDGPKPTGLRYCMNGVAMKFVPIEGAVTRKDDGKS